jgi:hypothetical protein
MFEEYGRTREYHTIMEIAESLRGEFGTGIDAHPGSATVEAGQANRTFRIVANRILKAIVADEVELRGLLTWVLRRAALRRLEASGVSAKVATSLVDLEPGLGDSWFAYLVLEPGTVILDLVAETALD